MNVLFIIGNGFDINIGLKTRYRDFYEYYLKKESKNEIINTFKKNLQENIENWSDLELEFGKYTKELKSINEFDIIFDDLTGNLVEYLIKIENEIPGKIKGIDRKLLFNDLFNPTKYIDNYFKDVINQYIISNYSASSSKMEYINIITFNYTQTLEFLLSENEEIQKEIKSNGIEKNVLNIEHIHGYLDSRTVIGVNHISQIANENFRKNLDVTEILVKPSYNEELRHNVDTKCKNFINKSDIFYIFGSSIGESDRLWWNLIINKLKSSASKVVIFENAPYATDLPEHKLVRIRRKLKQRFLSGFYETLKDDVFVCLNSNIFNITAQKENLKSKTSEFVNT